MALRLRLRPLDKVFLYIFYLSIITLLNERQINYTFLYFFFIVRNNFQNLRIEVYKFSPFIIVHPPMNDYK